MSRCSVCDYCQSADSSYHSGLYISHHAPANRVVYSEKLQTDICLTCLEAYTWDKNYWNFVDGSEDFNAYLPEEEPVSEYEGCTDKPTD